MTADVPVTLGLWLVSLLPIVTLLVFLLLLNWSAPEAGAVGMFVAAGAAILALRTPVAVVAVASAKGVWDAVFVLYVVWTALLLYHLADRAGAFSALRIGITRYSRNELFLVLVFGWVFTSFLQGITGFGTPVAMAAPILLALGVRPVFAVAIPLIGHAWGNLFGTLAVAWLATLQVLTVDDPTLAATQAALLLCVPVATTGVIIGWFYGRWPAVRHALPMVLAVSVLHGGLQLWLVGWNPVLSNFLAVTAGFALLLILVRWRRYRQPADLPASPIMRAPREMNSAAADERSTMTLGLALMPYGVLCAVAILVLVPPPVADAVDRLRVGLPFPAVATGLGVERAATDAYAPFAPLTHPGTFLIAAALAAWIVYYRVRGIARADRSLWNGFLHDAVPASLAVIAFLVTSRLMDHSGQTTVLALGIADVAPPTLYASLSNTVGVVGAFITSSTTASNVLFAPVQETVAELVGLSVPTVIAAQSVGATIGNAIAPANIVLGTGTAGIIGQEGLVMRQTLAWTIGMSVAIGLMTLWLL